MSSSPGPNGQSATALQLPAPDLLSRNAQGALARSDVNGVLLHALGVDAAGKPVAKAIAESDPAQYARLRAFVEHIIALREQNVAAIGNDSAFVVRGPHGELRRVTQRVELSLHRNELYQIPFTKRPKRDATDEERAALAAAAEDARCVAMLKVDGYRALNRVAGIHVGLSDTVIVDGVARTNPYVEREPGGDGDIGVVRRVVCCHVAAGLSAVGSPVIVRYVLEYCPRTELKAALMRRYNYLLGTNYGQDVVLLPDAAIPDFLSRHGDKAPMWKVSSLFGGMSLVFDTSSPFIVGMLTEHYTVLMQAERRAQTFSCRNAMKAHPMLAYPTVRINPSTGTGHVVVTGWSGSTDVLSGLRAQFERVVHAGTDIVDEAGVPGVAVIDVREDFNPDEAPADTDSDSGDADRDAEEDDRDRVEEARQRALASMAKIKRGEVITEIDEMLAGLTPAQTQKHERDSGYSSETLPNISVERLQEIRDALRARIDAHRSKVAAVGGAK